jgi:integrase
MIEKIELDEAKEKVKDILLFQCYTGLRFEDTQRLKPEHFNNGRITLTAQKTTQNLYIPVIPEAEKIILKYKPTSKKTGKLLPQISNQKANDHLKEIGQIAGLDYDIIFYRYKGNKQVEFKMKRYDKLCTHDGRRTFITLCLQNGMSAQMIMRITGHRNYTTFERYVKFSEKIIAENLNFVWKQIHKTKE